MLETNDPLLHPSIHAGNSCQGHLTRSPRPSAGVPIDPAGLWCEGPLGALEAGASQPRRPLSAYNVLSAGGSPPPYSIQSHNAAVPGGGNRIWFVCWLVLEKKFPLHSACLVHSRLSLVHLPTSCIIWADAKSFFLDRSCKEKKELMNGKGERQTERLRASCLKADKKGIWAINASKSQYVFCLAWVLCYDKSGWKPVCCM